MNAQIVDGLMETMTIDVRGFDRVFSLGPPIDVSHNNNGMMGRIAGSFLVDVDETLTMDDAIKISRPDIVDPEIDSGRFQNSDIQTGSKTQKKIFLFCSNQIDFISEINSRVVRCGYRMASPSELIALSIEIPDLQRKFKILTLDQVQNIGGYNYALCLTGDRWRRKIALALTDFGLRGSLLFAVVKIDE